MRAGETISHYELVQPLGSGGMGQVWRAIDSRLNRPVAVKLLNPELTDDAEAAARFSREARTASALNHPNILTVFESGQSERTPFLATELIEGVNLRQLMEREALSPERIHNLALRCLDGLSAAHRLGIVHRDIKPENLMLRDDGQLKILDFGMAKPSQELHPHTFVTAAHHILGTPHFMSPEQLRGEELDGRSDLFSLGAVLYELACGRPAFPGNQVGEILANVLTRDPDWAALPAVLRAVVQGALQKEREARFADAEAMAAGLVGARSSVAAKPMLRLALLEFRAEPHLASLAAGLTSSLSATLVRVPGVRVVMAGTERADLAVDRRLEGSLRQGGNRLRATVSLLDARDSTVLWSQVLEKPSDDVFALEDALAEAVLSQLHLERPDHPRTQDSDAHYLYLEGLAHLNTYRTDSLELSIKQLESALRINPALAEAHAKLSHAFLLQMLTSPAGKRSLLLTRARVAAEQARDLDPDNPDALVSLALLAGNPMTPNLVETRRLLRKAVEAAPNHPEALTRLSYLNTTMGNIEAGERLARRAQAADPSRTFSYAWLAYARMSRGQDQLALDPIERALRLEGEQSMASFMALWLDLRLGQAQRALKYAEKLESSRTYLPPVISVAINLVRAHHGMPLAPTPPAAVDATAQMETDLFGALLLSTLGQPEAAVEKLQAAHVRGFRNYPLMENDPLLAPARSLPAFAALCLQMKEEIQNDSEFHEPCAEGW